MREVIRPSEDAIIVKLDYNEPIQREGRTGVDYQYTVNGDAGIMWLPKEAKARIDEIQAQAGDEISIARTKRGNRIQWLIELIADETAAPPPPSRSGAAPARQPAGPRPVEAPRARPQNGTPTNNGRTSEHRNTQRPGAALLAAALYCAIDAAIAAEEYATDKGRPLKLNTDDIRAMAISIYIDARKEAAKS